MVPGRQAAARDLPDRLRALPEVGSDVFLHTHQVVREDALQLFGFAEADERTLFVSFDSDGAEGLDLASLGLSYDLFTRTTSPSIATLPIMLRITSTAAPEMWPERSCAASTAPCTG